MKCKNEGCNQDSVNGESYCHYHMVLPDQFDTLEKAKAEIIRLDQKCRIMRVTITDLEAKIENERLHNQKTLAMFGIKGA